MSDYLDHQSYPTETAEMNIPSTNRIGRSGVNDVCPNQHLSAVQMCNRQIANHRTPEFENIVLYK
jgi:hypothetical protein